MAKSFPRVVVRGLDDMDDLVEIKNATYDGPLKLKGIRYKAVALSRGKKFAVSRLESLAWAEQVALFLAEKYDRTAGLDVRLYFDPSSEDYVDGKFVG